MSVKFGMRCRPRGHFVEKGLDKCDLYLKEAVFLRQPRWCKRGNGVSLLPAIASLVSVIILPTAVLLLLVIGILLVPVVVVAVIDAKLGGMGIAA